MKQLRVLGLFSEESIERTHHEAFILQGKTNNNDFEKTQEQVEKRRHMKLSPGVKHAHSKIKFGRKRNFGRASMDKTAAKVREKKEQKDTEYSQPIITLAENEEYAEDEL